MSYRRESQSPLQYDQSWSDDELLAALPLPAESDNKYSRGVFVVVAGSKRYPGAACLAARAGQRMGAGYTQLVTHKSAAKIALSAYPSLVVSSYKKWDIESSRCAKESSRCAVCVGPGFVPGDKKTDQLVLSVLEKANCPVLVDGGGLPALTSKKALKVLANRRDKGLATVITPHTGEAKSLREKLGLQDVSVDELPVVLSMATGAIVVMKDFNTFISADGHVYPMLEGTPSLAKAGTGDVLAGMIGALMAQGVEPIAAAVLGATIHARAGIEAAKTHTVIGVTPEDVIDAIPAAIRAFDNSGVLK